MNSLEPFNAVFFVGLIVYFRTRHVFMERTKAEKKEGPRVDAFENTLVAAMWPPVLIRPLVCLFTPLLSFADYHLSWFVLRAGVIMMLTALWLSWRSHVDSDQNWSVCPEVRENHESIRHGICRRVRHPMYASIWLWGIPQAMLLQTSFAGWAVMVSAGPA